MPAITRSMHLRSPWASALWISAGYAAAGVLWILLSDRAVERLTGDIVTLTTWQSWKGWTFVLVTAGLLTWVLQRQFRRLHAEVASRQDAEQSARQALEQFRLATHASQIGIWDWNLRTDEVMFSDEWFRQLGYEPGEIDSSFHAWQERLHPDDLGRVTAALQAYLQKAAPDYSVDFRLRHRDGSWRWIHARALRIDREDGHPVRLAGTHVEVTARHFAEEQLRDSERRLRQLSARLAHYLQTSPAITYALRIEGGTLRTVWISENLPRILGYSMHEAMEPDWWLQHIFTEDRQQGEKSLSALLAEGRYTHEYRFHHRDGRLLWIRDEMRLRRSETGTPEEIVGTWVDVTPQRDANRRLDDIRQRFDLATRGAAAGLWDWNVLTNEMHLSERCHELLGYRPDELPQAFASFEKLLHREDQPRLMGAVRRHFETHEPCNVDCRLLASSGGYRWFNVRGQALWNDRGQPVRMAGSLIDIHERRRTELSLRAERERYHSLFKSNPHPMWVYDLGTLRFLAVNDAAVRHYGYSREEFLAMTIRDIRPPQDVPALLENVAAVSGGIDEAGVWRHSTRDGRILDVEITSHTLEYDGRPAEVVLAHDVTARLALERRLRGMNMELTERVRERTAQLAAKNEALESFCYSVAHDLKAPLRSISGYGSLLVQQSTALDGEGRRYLHRMVGAAGRMARLIDDLLAYSRLEQRSLSLQTFALQPLIDAEVAAREADLAGADLAVETGDCRVLGDPEGLALAVRNLLDNAIKFSARAARRSIRVSARTADGRCIVSIADNGTGFDMAHAGKIFGIFERLHRADEYPGTGVGLAIVAKAMSRMGGRTWAESAPGQGATFHLELPLAATPGDGQSS